MLKKSRIATVLASLAVASLAAPPAMANHRGWGGWGGWGHRHRDRIDTGDVLAGILIIGGIAAVASAASNANKNKQRDRDRDYRYPERDYPQARERSGGYADNDRGERQDWRGTNTGIDGAIDRCMDEVARGSAKIEEVDSVNRDGDGWRVQGRMSGGGDFSCSIDGDGRIRNVNIDGKAV